MPSGSRSHQWLRYVRRRLPLSGSQGSGHDRLHGGAARRVIKPSPGTCTDRQVREPPGLQGMCSPVVFGGAFLRLTVASKPPGQCTPQAACPTPPGWLYDHPRGRQAARLQSRQGAGLERPARDRPRARRPRRHNISNAANSLIWLSGALRVTLPSYRGVPDGSPPDARRQTKKPICPIIFVIFAPVSPSFR